MKHLNYILFLISSIAIVGQKRGYTSQVLTCPQLELLQMNCFWWYEHFLFNRLHIWIQNGTAITGTLDSLCVRVCVFEKML